ncbi:glycosyltransferase [Empedobacter falsenii]
MINLPKVSVVTITYGHQDYIIETIKGVLKQNYKGKIEFIISNDNSPDDTDQVISDFFKSIEIPSHIDIKYIKHKENKGAIPNFAWTISQCTGKYIAICEGDDYWTDPHKLQKQIDFLEENEDCSLVYHRVQIYDEEEKFFSEEILNKSLTIQKRTIEELALNGNFIHTPSVLFRNNLILPERLFKLTVGDYVLWFLNGEKGKLGYLPDQMAVYRFSEKSTWGKKSDYYRIFNWLKVLSSLKQYSKNIIIKELLKKQAWISYKELKIMTFAEKLHVYKILLKIEPRFIKRILLNRS